MSARDRRHAAQCAVRTACAVLRRALVIGAFATAVGVRAESPADSAASPLGAALARAAADVEAARHDLAQETERVTGERRARAAHLDALRHERRTLEAKIAAAREAGRDLHERLTAGATRERELGHVVETLDALLLDYRRAFETRLSAGEAHLLAPALEEIDRSLAAADAVQRLEAAEPLLRLITQTSAERLGGRRFAGKALDASGHVVAGRFVQFGPLSYFAADHGDAAGIVRQHPGGSLPRVHPGGTAAETAQVRVLVAEGRAARVPVDPTGGAALRLRQAREPLLEHLRKGGVVMVPLLILAGVCTGLTLFKLVTLQRLDVRQMERRVMDILDAIRTGNAAAALERARSMRRPLGPVLVVGIEHRDAPKEHIEEIMYEQILAQVPALERFLSPLAVCASAAPLLGLLGTVTGMIRTFRLITLFGTGDARLLSSGISEALITTEVGLIIAIPTLLIHAYLSRCVRRGIARTQQAAIMFVNGLKLRETGSQGR